MKKADFEKKMNTLIRDLDENDLEKMTRMIEQMKLERFESETLRKQQFAGILADTDLISVYLNFTRLTRPTDPFREGTIHVIGVTIPFHSVNSTYSNWTRADYYDPMFRNMYTDAHFKSKKKDVVPLLVIDNAAETHLMGEDKIKICGETFKMHADNTAHKTSELGKLCVWSVNGRVDYSRSNVKKIVDDWFKQFVAKHDLRELAD